MNIRLIGAFSVVGADGGPGHISGRKDRAVLAFLAAHPGRAIARDRLAELIWPSVAEGSARASLRQSISTIRKALPDPDILIAGRDSVSLDADRVVTDLQLLGTRDATLDDIPLASGETFLDDLSGISAEFDSWRAAEQSRVVALVTRILGDAARHADNAREYARSVAALSQLAALDPLNEDIQRRLMTSLVLAGQPNAAIRQYRLLERVLAEDLGVAPEEATRAVLAEARGRAARMSEPATAETVDPADPPQPAGAAPSIRVHPFRDLSPAPEEGQFADWLTESLTATLSQISGLNVVVEADGAEGRALDTVAADRFALHGTVRQAAGQVRVGARLVEERTGRVAWAEEFDRRMDNVFEVHDDITYHITVEMRVKLSEGEKVRGLEHRGRNLEVWRLLLRADVLCNTLVEADNIEARRLLEEALKIDPGYAPAWTQLADTYIGDYMMGRRTFPPEEYLEKAEDSATRALRADPGFASADNILAYVETYRGQHDRAVDRLRRASAGAPRNSEVVATFAYVLAFAGEIDAARDAIGRAIALTPISPMWYFAVRGLCDYLSERWSAAVAELTRAVAMEPDSAFARPYLLGALMEAGDPEAAQREAQAILRIEPGMTVSTWPGAHFKDTAWRKRLQDSLISAGIPV